MNGSNRLIPSEQIRVTGLWHKQQGIPCEDVSIVREDPDFCFYGVADGQSGARRCIAGARAALEVTADFLRRRGLREIRGSRFPDEYSAELMHAIRVRLLTLAKEEGADFDDYSSTLLAAGLLPDTGDGILIHLGDGCALGIREDDSPVVLSAPDNGPDPRFTWLTTSQNAAQHLDIRFFSGARLKRLALLTDGACALCRGRNIPAAASRLLAVGTPEEIGALLERDNPRDDALCLLVRFL